MFPLKGFGKSRREFDPTKMPHTEMMTLFTNGEGHLREEGQKQLTRNFITFIQAPEEEDLGKGSKIRVNCKYEPKETKITFPPSMEGYAKTVLGHVRHTDEWIALQDRDWPDKILHQRVFGFDIHKL